MVDDEGDGEVRWRGTKGSEEEVGRRGLAVEAARESGARSSSPWLACVCVSGGGVGGREGEIERRGSGLGLTGHRLGCGWALEAGPRRLDGLVAASEQKGQPSRYFPPTEK